MAQRIKGQEVKIQMVGPSGKEDGIIDVQSFEASFQVERLEENYLGETTTRYDDIFNGVKGKIELHLENQTYFRFMERVQRRAQRRDSADGQFNIMAVLKFPNGQKVRVLLEDVFFGEIPLNVSSRSDYVQTSVDWGCSNGRFLL